MKPQHPVLILLVLFAGLSLFSGVTPDMKDDYDQLWARVDSLQEQGLPRSAWEVVDRIISLARDEQNDPQLLKALLHRSKYVAALEEDEINRIVSDLKIEVERVSAPSSAVLHSILGEIYWRYYQSNRHMYLDRTATSGIAEDDVTTWDQRKIVGAAVGEFARSVQDISTLSAIPVAEYIVLLQSNGRDRLLRPTLYDFLAHRALDVFENSEAGLAEPLEPFRFNDPRFMGTAEGFVGLEIESPDSLSTEYLAIRLYQDLVRFHLTDTEPDALVDVDLGRLAFVRKASTVADRDSAYVARLREMDERFSGRSAGTSITHALASTLVSEGYRYDPLRSDRFKWRMKEADDLCTAAIDRFPDSFGSAQCAALQSSIREKSAQFQIEDVVTPGQPFKLRLQYRNVEKMFVAVVPVDMQEMMTSSFLSGSDRDERNARLIARARSFDGVFDLPRDGDYQSHSTELMIPALPTGLYAALVGSHAEFRQDGQARGIVYFAASKLGIVERRDEDASLQVRVLDRARGVPIVGATVTLWGVEYVDRRRNPDKYQSFKTNDDGVADILHQDGGSFFLTVVHGDDRLVSMDWRYRWGGENPQLPHDVTRLFTDRAIYRPGQPVHFKGILLRKSGERHEIRAGERTTVRLTDPNRRELVSLDLESNEYGTVSGRFDLPTGAGTGEMTIRDADGSVSFSVEEYKRPRFEVSFDPVEGEVELGNEVTVSGSALAFSGAPVDGAAVRYRVTRTPVFRPWQYWWGIHPPQADAEIATGVAETDSEGHFSLSFVARPDDEIPPSANPIFRYKVVADVTDFAGETRSGVTSVRVGYASLLLGIEGSEFRDRDALESLEVTAENVEGVTVSASGRLVISRLRGPARLLRERPWPQIDRPVLTPDQHSEHFPMDVYANENDPGTWSVAEVALETAFNTGDTPTVSLGDVKKWPPGVYRVEVTATDARGREVQAVRMLTLYSIRENRLPLKNLDWFVPVTASGEPGETARLLIGSAAKDVPVFVEVEKRGRIVETRRLRLSNSQQLLEFPIEEDDRGNYAVHVSFVRHGRAVVHSQTITVPYTNKQLTLKLETFRDELYPGQDEEWRLRITGSKGEPVAAELLAAMYDASLDQFVAHDWRLDLHHSRTSRLGWVAANEWGAVGSAVSGLRWNRARSARRRSYDMLNWFGLDRYFGSRLARAIMEMSAVPSDAMMADGAVTEAGKMLAEDEEAASPPVGDEPVVSQAGPVRTNFSETAFFLPDLRTDEDGTISFAFTIPEALTRWRMLGIAHTTDLRVGTLEAFTVTRKDLMITANAPRFLREGDDLRFAASVQSLAEESLSGTARLSLFDAVTMQPLDREFSSDNTDLEFTLAPGQSQGLRWSISVPEGVDAIVYRVTADAGSQSDGEQKPLPVLTNRMLVTESLPLPVRGPGTYPFTFKRLRDNKSQTLRHHALTLEYSPNPVWYAVQALPYMMEFPHECSEQVFSRLYANSIAAHIVEQNPRIRTVFDRWRDLEAGALQSNLEKNQELKSLVIEETPWLLAAQNESERKRRMAVLFDFARMSNERATAIQKLTGAQHGSGAWPWFNGMRPSRHITQHIVAGFGHLNRLGIFDPESDPALGPSLARAVAYLDREIKADYDELVERKANLNERHLGWLQIHYLYARSFFGQMEIPEASQPAVTYYLDQARRFWLQNEMYGQGMIALALHRWGDTKIPGAIMRSLAETASHSDELGMYWKYNRGYFWYQAPIETQALMVEAFDEIDNNSAAVADLQLWLLKQKQTQDWKTTKATTEAVYALLMRGTQLLDEESHVTISVGDETIDSRSRPDAEEGTGYFTTSWEGDDISSDMATVEVTKVGPGPAWGALYWQYFEQLDRITPAETPLSIEKKLFREELSNAGPVLRPLDQIDDLATGDKIVVRVIIRVDRDMEYVHLKDMRGAGLEPINVLSGYRYKGGLGYYESTRDAATHFFIGYLPKGTYVFEYPLRVNLAGDFSNGITSIQSMYAPEFTSHSEGVRVQVVD
ncbi:MAG: hypothetical protein HKN37_10880 [Rhodothermales bacterium]|nr:hypothetical protein [Rhodothermales bacterium]